MVRKGNRVRHITTGGALREEDDRKSIVRDPTQSPLDVHHDGGVDYERMWKNLRTDSEIFWINFLPHVQAGLCAGCQEHFTKVFSEANRKSGLGIREGAQAGCVPPEKTDDKGTEMIKRHCDVGYHSCDSVVELTAERDSLKVAVAMHQRAEKSLDVLCNHYKAALGDIVKTYANHNATKEVAYHRAKDALETSPLKAVDLEGSKPKEEGATDYKEEIKSLCMEIIGLSYESKPDPVKILNRSMALANANAAMAREWAAKIAEGEEPSADADGCSCGKTIAKKIRQ